MVESGDKNGRSEAFIAEERERLKHSEALHDKMFRGVITARLETARQNGLRVGACFYSPKGELLAYGADETEHAASINKLAVAAYVIDNPELFPPDRLFGWREWDEKEILLGAGKYDKTSLGEGFLAPRSATVKELLEDMLTRSGNTAMKVLASGRAEAINEYLANMGFEHTRLEVLSDGGFYTGTTSAREAIFLMRTLAGEPVVDEAEGILSGFETVEGDELGRIAALALRKSNRSVVWRRLEKAVDELELATKVGELHKIGQPGDTDYNPNLQHEVGVMYYGSNEWLSYSVLLSSDKKRNYVAKQIIGQIGSEVASYLGIKKRLHVPTFAMMVALRASGEKLLKS